MWAPGGPSDPATARVLKFHRVSLQWNLQSSPKMHSQPGTAGDASRSPSETRSDRGTRYRDADPARAKGDDLELGGSVPLLPGHPDDFDDDEDDDEFNFDREDRYDPPFSCTFAGFVAWCRGPVPPQIYRINPWFPKWQAAPARLVDRWAPKRAMKTAALLLGVVFWIAVFFSSLKASVAEQEVLGYGQPVKLSCHHRLWYVRRLQKSTDPSFVSFWQN